MGETREQARTTGYAIFLHCHWCRDVQVRGRGARDVIDACPNKACALWPFRPTLRPSDP